MTFDIQKLKKEFVKVEPAKVTDKEVEYLLENMARNVAQPVLVERAAKNGDAVVVSYKAVDADGKEKLSVPREGFFLGAGEVMPELEEALLGVVAGGKKFVDIKFPEDHPVADLRGEKLSFEVEVLEVHELDVPAIEDDLAVKLLGEGKTIDDLKAALRSELVENRKKEARRQMEMEIIELIAKLADVQIADEMIDAEMQLMKESAYKVAEQKGMSREDYDKELAKAGGVYEGKLLEQAKKNLIVDSVLTELVAAGTLQISDDEVKEAILKEVDHFSDEDKEKVKSGLQEDARLLEQMRKRMQLHKLFDSVIFEV